MAIIGQTIESACELRYDNAVMISICIQNCSEYTEDGRGGCGKLNTVMSSQGTRKVELEK